MQGVKDTQLLKIVKSVVMYGPIAQNYIQSGNTLLIFKGQDVGYVGYYKENGHSLIVQPLGMRDEIKILN